MRTASAPRARARLPLPRSGARRDCALTHPSSPTRPTAAAATSGSSSSATPCSGSRSRRCSTSASRTGREGELTRARAALVNRRVAGRARARARAAGPGAARPHRGALAGARQGFDPGQLLRGGGRRALPRRRPRGGAVARGALLRDACWRQVPRAATPRPPSRNGRTRRSGARRATTRSGDSGVEDDGDRFTVEVRVGGEPYGRGVGRTKRAAETAAAEQALLRVGEA